MNAPLSVVERYHEVLAYRVEGIKRYGGRLASDIYGVPVRVSFPSLSLQPPLMPAVRIGPLYAGDRPPILGVLNDVFAQLPGPLTIVELGPGKGTMAGALRAAFSAKIARYVGIERDASVTGPYERIADISALPPRIDVLIASEVIEHIPLADFFDGMLPAIVAAMTPNAVAVLGTPNALAPTSIFNDFTHVQGYNCMDLYGLMRLFFGDVAMYRSRYVWSFERLVTLLPRMMLSRALELDWCEGLICVARAPRNLSSPERT
jgi:hypothetical protein